MLIKTPIQHSGSLQQKRQKHTDHFIITKSSSSEENKSDNQNEIAEIKPPAKEFIKTNEQQQSATKPENAHYQSHLNTRAEGAREEARSVEEMPTQDGQELKDEIVLFDQDRVDGDLDQTSDRPLIPSPPTMPSNPSPTENMADQMTELAQEQQPTPLQPETQPRDVSAPQPRDLMQDANKNHESEQQNAPNDLAQQKEGTQSDARQLDQNFESIQSLSKIQLPENRFNPSEYSSATPNAVNNPNQVRKPVYDPIFASDAQPGANTYEKKTKTVGRFSFGRRASLDVEQTDMGIYQLAVYRAIASVWYKVCDVNRDKIITGVVTIRIHVNKQGKVISMKQVSREGASEAQNAFTMQAIKDAPIPPIPTKVQSELPGDRMEFFFNFYF